MLTFGKIVRIRGRCIESDFAENWQVFLTIEGLELVAALERIQ